MSKINIAKVQSKDPLYNEADSYQYNLVINCWVALWEDLYPQGVDQLVATLYAYGLTKTIQEYDDVATRIINNLDHNTIITSMLNHIGIKATLLLYRFPKRYTWVSLPQMEADERTKFLSRNNRVKQLNRRGISGWLYEALHTVANAPVRSFDGPVDVSILYDIPTGACAEGYTLKAQKLLDICDHIPFGPFNVPLGGGTAIQNKCSRGRFVPKNYKALRGISMEPVYSQFLATQVSKGLDRLFGSKKSIYHPHGRLDLHSQDRSRELAVEGSKTGDVATIDLTAASDSLSYPVVDACTPDCFAAWWRNQSVSIDLDGKVYTLHIPLPMGSRVTMALQTYVYWVMCCVACTLCAQDDKELTRLLDQVAVYGDDIIIPTVAASTLLDILVRCGLQPNLEKSFYDPDYKYREACGIEAYNGEVVSSCYWPRGVMEKPEQLVSLYNRVFTEFGFLENFHGAIRKYSKWNIADTTDPDAFGYLVTEDTYLPAIQTQLPFEFNTQDDSDNQASVDLHKFFTCRRTKLVVESKIDTKTIRQAREKCKWDLEEAADVYLYYSFLHDGPQYDDKLMELLGCSTQRSVKTLLSRENASRVMSYYDWDVFF